MSDSRTTETKASRLKELSQIVKVPDFVIINKNSDYHLNLDRQGQYLVRSASKLEDQGKHSYAGQFPTIGPVRENKIPAAINQVFQNHYHHIEEVIVQKFIDAKQWGVAFCFSEQKILIEYTGIFEGVTSGTVNPFSALLPTQTPRYKKLEAPLLKIFKEFGPCDVEFVNLDHPQFVQVRPITKDIKFDQDFVKLKMQLQELDNMSWKENDVCRMLAERDHKSQAISELYLKAIQNVYAEHFKQQISITHKPFIKISDQFFMDQHLEKQITPGFFNLLRLGFKISKIMNEIKTLDFAQLSTIELMQWSILMSLAYELFNIQKAMELREMLRIELEHKIPEGTIIADFHYHKVLGDLIDFDKQHCLWKDLALRDEQGIVVVEGKFHQGPYFLLKNPQQKIPPGVFVVTEHLHPEIGQYMPNIKGIICKYGALSSHIAILAREYAVPLWIQTDIKPYESIKK